MSEISIQGEKRRGRPPGVAAKPRTQVSAAAEAVEQVPNEGESDQAQPEQQAIPPAPRLIITSEGSETALDQELKSLQQIQDALQASISKLKSGNVTLEAMNGSKIEMDISQVSNPEKILAANSLYQSLQLGQKNKQELLADLLSTGEVDPRFQSLIIKNKQANRAVEAKMPSLKKFISSPFLLVAGIILLILIIWFISMNLNGDVDNFPPLPTTTTTSRITGQGGGGQIRYISQSQSKNQPISSSDEGDSQEQGEDSRVGQPPTSSGGLNGPHGAFYAPATLAIPAIQLLIPQPVGRAQTQPGDGITTNTNRIFWPETKAGIKHFGNYPGELGRQILLINQGDLPPNASRLTLLDLQLNDLLQVADRNGNTFGYRVIEVGKSVDIRTVTNWFNPTQTPATYSELILLITPASRQGEYLIDSPASPTRHVIKAVLSSETRGKPKETGNPVEVPKEAWEIVNPGKEVVEPNKFNNG